MVHLRMSDLFGNGNEIVEESWKDFMPTFTRGGELNPQESQMTEITTKEFFHSPYNLSSYMLTVFLKKHFEEKVSVLDHVKSSIWIQQDNFYPCIEMLTDKYGFISMPANDVLLFQRDDTIVLMTRCKKKEFDNIQIYSTSRTLAKEILVDVRNFDAQIKKLSFNWIVNNKGDSVDMVEEWEETVDANLYPFIENFDTYAQRFIESKSNILIMLGPPGTGKTTMIKHILSVMDKSAFVTYDESVLSSDGPFADFMSSSAGAFVIEDADLFLKSRADGNGMVSRFLNVGDGLIKLKEKLLIFSTNIENVSSLDAALIRPGRCFDILEFRALTKLEAQVVADDRGLVLVDNKDTFTLAEIFNSPIKMKPQKSMGFI